MIIYVKRKIWDHKKQSIFFCFCCWVTFCYERSVRHSGYFYVTTIKNNCCIWYFFSFTNDGFYPNKNSKSKKKYLKKQLPPKNRKKNFKIQTKNIFFSFKIFFEKNKSKKKTGEGAVDYQQKNIFHLQWNFGELNSSQGRDSCSLR